MIVKRIVANIATSQMDAAKTFYGTVLGMALTMDHGWIITLVGCGDMTPQISFAAEGGSGTPVPDLSIEVDDLEEAQQRVCDAGYHPEYGPVSEPWGVRRFFVRDPFGAYSIFSLTSDNSSWIPHRSPSALAFAVASSEIAAQRQKWIDQEWGFVDLRCLKAGSFFIYDRGRLINIVRTLLFAPLKGQCLKSFEALRPSLKSAR